MNKQRLFLVCSVMLILALAFPLAASADGIIVPDPPICIPEDCPPIVPLAQLVIRYHEVTVEIDDQVAITRVDQVFYNPNSWQIEGTYVFPIPKEAVVNSFTLWVDGQPVEGKILDAAQARQTYEEIVRTLRDPALLEYVGQGAVQARIFPIPSGGERRVQLEYTQALTADNNLVHYIYPLGTEKFSTFPLERVTIRVDVRSKTPIRAIYSPSHEVDIARESDTHIRIGYEASHILPDTDFGLYYSLGETEAFHLLTYRDPSDPTDPDGFFLALLAPRPGAGTQMLAKDVILVLDRSGSMDGEKFLQAQEALRFILQHLNPEDRFNLISFSTGVEVYARSMRPASEVNEALPWVNQLSAQGSTDINRALLEAAALTDRERPTYVIFLTDGLPTEGETDSQKIVSNLGEAAPKNLRLFVFGVGYDVDTFLLDSLAQAHHGASSYVLPGEKLDEILSTFYAKISTPVLTDLLLDFGNLAVYDIYPNPLPDLFAGSQIIAVGRYRQPGSTTATLRGYVNEQVQTFEYTGQVFQADTRDDAGVLAALPRLWATRKVGYLLNQIRLQGPNQETIDQIVRLSIRYGIVTPYTSYLVTENVALGEDALQNLVQEQYEVMQSAPAESVSGAGAVQKAKDEGTLFRADQVQAPPAEAASRVRIVNARTFVFSEGVWIDTAFDPQQMQTMQVPFLSDSYFSLLEARPDLGGAFALGQRVIALSDGIAYEVVAPDSPVEPFEMPATSTPAPIKLAATATAVAISQGQTPVVENTQEASPTPAARSSESPACWGALLPLMLMIVRLLWLRFGSPHRSLS